MSGSIFAEVKENGILNPQYQTLDNEVLVSFERDFTNFSGTQFRVITRHNQKRSVLLIETTDSWPALCWMDSGEVFSGDLSTKDYLFFDFKSLLAGFGHRLTEISELVFLRRVVPDQKTFFEDIDREIVGSVTHAKKLLTKEREMGSGLDKPLLYAQMQESFMYHALKRSLLLRWEVKHALTGGLLDHRVVFSQDDMNKQYASWITDVIQFRLSTTGDWSGFKGKRATPYPSPLSGGGYPLAA